LTDTPRPLPTGWIVAAGVGAALMVGVLPPPRSTLPSVRDTHGFTDWGWGHEEEEEPLYTVLKEPASESFEWRLLEGSIVQIELEPYQMEPVRALLPLSGSLRGSASDLDRTRGRVRADLHGLAEGTQLADGWAALVAEESAAGHADILVVDARIGAAPERLEERTQGTVDLRIEYLGREVDLRLPVEVERVEEDVLLVSSVGRNAVALAEFGPLAENIGARIARPLGASLGVEFQVDIGR
jgi:hypothetical protein